MTDIHVKPTNITTDLPGNSQLNLGDGVAMFPQLGSFVGSQLKLNKGNGTWINKTLNFELFKVAASINHSTFVGVAGPSYAVDLDVDPATFYTVPPPGQAASGELVASTAELRGGFQFGVDFQINGGVTFTSPFATRHQVPIPSPGFDLDWDLIYLIFSLIEAILGDDMNNKNKNNSEGDLQMSNMDTSATGQLDEVQEIDNPTGSPPSKGKGSVRPEFSGSGMIDYIAQAWFPGAGLSTRDLQPADAEGNYPPQSTLRPVFAWGFSLIPLCEGIPFLDALYAFNEALKPLGGGFGIGPGVAVGLPVTVKLKGATINNHRFSVTEARAEPSPTGKLLMPLKEQSVDPNQIPLAGQPVDEIGLLLEHEVGFSISVYFFGDLEFAKVFHIGFQTQQFPVVDVTKLAGKGGGPFETELPFVAGGGRVPFSAPDTAPTVNGYTANQPVGKWKNGVLAGYAVTYFNSDYETPLGPFSPFNPQDRFFALPHLTNVDTPTDLSDEAEPQGRRIYRRFNDGSPIELVGQINDITTTTFTDTNS